MFYHSYTLETQEYNGSFEADLDPLEEGVYVLPGHATWVEPPAPVEGKWRKFDGEAWVYEDIAEPEEEPEPEVSKPDTISDRQFFQALANRNMITRSEALAAVSVGTIPAAMEAILTGLDDDEEFNARMLLSGATQFNRSHPITLAFAAGFNMSEADVEDLWVEANQL